MKLTKRATVNCDACRGEGWLPIYHNDTEDCYACDGTGKKKALVPISFDELKSLVNREFSNASDTDNFLDILEIYTEWKKQPAVRRSKPV